MIACCEVALRLDASLFMLVFGDGVSILVCLVLLHVIVLLRGPIGVVAEVQLRVHICVIDVLLLDVPVLQYAVTSSRCAVLFSRCCYDMLCLFTLWCCCAVASMFGVEFGYVY